MLLILTRKTRKMSLKVKVEKYIIPKVVRYKNTYSIIQNDRI